jgi:fatty acid synthase subunit alpha
VAKIENSFPHVSWFNFDRLSLANLAPGKFRTLMSGPMGHSQAIVSAIVIAASGTGTFKEFVDNCHKATKWLLYSGLRGQQAFPITSVEPSIVQAAIVGREGTTRLLVQCCPLLV